MEHSLKNKQFQEIRKQVQDTSIHISDVTDQTKTRFKELAKVEFDNHYGWTLKWLIDFRDGILEHPNQQLSDRIDFLADEINTLKQEKQKPKEPEIRAKMLSGKVIR